MLARKKKDTGAVDPSLPPIPKELLDQLVTGPMTAEAVEAVMRQFKKAFIERALGAEMTHHLGYEPGGAKPEGAADHRNGSTGKTVLTDDGALRIEVPRDRTRDILGLWIENTEGAKFWMKVFNDIKTRGVADILIAVTDGLKGMPKALAAVYPASSLQTCIVHVIRNNLDYASWKDRRPLAAALRPIYTALNADMAQAELDAFEQGPWGQKFPTVVAS